MGKRPNPELHARRRAEISAAARTVFAEKGYHAAQIADIAAALGIGHGTVYRYFKDKRAVFLAVLQDVVATVASNVAIDAPAADSLPEYREQVVRIGARLFDLVVEQADLFRLIFDEAPAVDRHVASDVADALDTFAMVTESYLVNGQAKGFLRADVDAHVAAYAINSMIFEGARVVLRSDRPEAVRDQWLATVPDLFLAGIAA